MLAAKTCPTCGQILPAKSKEAFFAVLSEAAAAFGVSPWDILTPKQTRQITDARHVAMYVLYHKFGWTLQHIGFAMMRDHSSVVHAKKKVDDMREQDELFDHQVERVLHA